ncbi:MAG TPA: hypothetical protein VMB02_04575 [Candidatus Aquilonibacter sp.]|nr:hypothetical protein [Candidatus Aquilonibacter sp.]
MAPSDPSAKSELTQIVQSYLAAAGEFGRPVALSALGLSPKQIEDALGTLDEDYHISRFLHFQCSAGANYQINGFPQTHVSIDADIQSML